MSDKRILEELRDVSYEIFDTDKNYPVVLKPTKPDCSIEEFIAWHRQNKAVVDQLVHIHGAVLFRGFNVDNEEDFARARDEVFGQSLDYVDGNSPRTKLKNQIYTTTEYPADQEISMHNELSYSSRWPARLILCCIEPASEGGETPLADCRQVLRALRPETAEIFLNNRVKYIRNLHDGAGMGPSWQDTFETTDRSAVEKFCTEGNIEFRWKEDGGIWLCQVGLGTAVHPETKEVHWFNQVDQFHPTNLPEEMCEYLMFEYEGREEELPLYSCLEDGTQIPLDVYEEIRRVNKEQSVYAPWHKGDLLIVDNMLLMHGRNWYAGPRRILISLSSKIWSISESDGQRTEEELEVSLA